MIPAAMPAPGDDITAAWWDGTRSGVLYLQTCRGCGRVQHHPRALCLGCGSADGLDWIRASGDATIDTWTEVRRAPTPDLEVPYVVARVRLAEGPMVLTNLVDVATDQLAVGRQVRVVWRPLPDGRQLPMFTLSPNVREGQ